MFETDLWFQVEDMVSNFMKKRIVISINMLGMQVSRVRAFARFGAPHGVHAGWPRPLLTLAPPQLPMALRCLCARPHSAHAAVLTCTAPSSHPQPPRRGP